MTKTISIPINQLEVRECYNCSKNMTIHAGLTNDERISEVDYEKSTHLIDYLNLVNVHCSDSNSYDGIPMICNECLERAEIDYKLKHSILFRLKHNLIAWYRKQTLCKSCIIKAHCYLITRCKDKGQRTANECDK